MPSTQQRRQLQQKCVELTFGSASTPKLQTSKLKAAVKYADQALEGAEGVERANILRDKAEALGKLGRLDESRECIEESEALLSVQFNPAEFAASEHYRGRLERRKGSHKSAFFLIEHATDLIADYNQKQLTTGKEFDPEEIFCRLDKSSTAALVGRSRVARKEAWRSLRLIHKIDHPAVTPAHIKRAILLWLFSRWPMCPWKPVRLAFFGNEARVQPPG
jgi:hypothetical protein